MKPGVLTSIVPTLEIGRVRASVLVLLLACGCRSAQPEAGSTDRWATGESEVRSELAAIAADLARDGPEAWLRHFVDDGTFWMASDGELKFGTLEIAAQAVRDIAPTIARMDLDWPDPLVEVLASDLASFGVDYEELLVDTEGKELRFRGYVTGLLVLTDDGWRVRQLHWSMLPP